MIKKYFDFINENLEFLLNESNVVFSDKLRRALTKIDSPIAKKMLDIENKDFPVQANYFDVREEIAVVNFINSQSLRYTFNYVVA